MSLLCDAVQKGSLTEVRERLSAGDPADEIDEHSGDALLTLAAMNGSLDIARALLDAGAHPNDRRSVIPPLVAAAGMGYPDIVALLLEREADVDARNAEGGTALMMAAAGGHLSIVNLLLEADADVRIRDQDGMRAIHFAAEKQHEAIVEAIAPYSTASDVRQAELTLRVGKSGATKEDIRNFHRAAKLGDMTAVEAYLDSGRDVDAMNTSGETALFFAARRGHIDVIKLLIARGANVNHLDTGDNSALLSAFNEKGMPAYEYLRPLVAPPVLKKWDKWLARAVKRAETRYPEMAKLLRAQHPEPFE
jgi:ankyrin repeat protein